MSIIQSSGIYLPNIRCWREQQKASEQDTWHSKLHSSIILYIRQYGLMCAMCIYLRQREVTGNKKWLCVAGGTKTASKLEVDILYWYIYTYVQFIYSGTSVLNVMYIRFTIWKVFRCRLHNLSGKVIEVLLYMHSCKCFVLPNKAYSKPTWGRGINKRLMRI